MSKLKIKSTALILGVLVMSLVVGYVVFAWDEPLSSPPTCNTGDPGCDPPLNTGPGDQTKAGSLTFSSFVDGDGDHYYVDPASAGDSAIFLGEVGIGLTDPNTPQYDLHVVGDVYADQFCLSGDLPCLAIWPTGGSGGADDDWYISGSDMYASTNVSQVGIGITNPTEALHIVEVNPTLYLKDSATNMGGAKVKLMEEGNLGGFLYFDNLDNKFHVGVVAPGAGDIEVITIDGSYRVGIGTDSLTERLEVEGNIRLGSVSPAYRIMNVDTPVAASDVATKGYVDSYLSSNCVSEASNKTVMEEEWTTWSVFCSGSKVALGGGIMPIDTAQVGSSTVFTSWAGTGGNMWECGAFHGGSGDIQLSCVVRCCGI